MWWIHSGEDSAAVRDRGLNRHLTRADLKNIVLREIR